MATQTFHGVDPLSDPSHSEHMPDDRALDEMLDETFPASDPPSSTGETGIRVTIPVVDDGARRHERD